MGEGSGGGFITRCMLEPVLRILRYRLLLTGKCTHYYANVCVCGKCIATTGVSCVCVCGGGGGYVCVTQLLSYLCFLLP